MTHTHTHTHAHTHTHTVLKLLCNFGMFFITELPVQNPSLEVLTDPQNAVKAFSQEKKGPFTDCGREERRLGREGVMGVEWIIQINRVVISPTPACCCYC